MCSERRGNALGMTGAVDYQAAVHLVMTGRWVGNDGELGLNSVPLLV